MTEPNRKTFTRTDLYRRYGKEIGVAAAISASRYVEGYSGNFVVSEKEIDIFDIDRAERIFQIVAERAGEGTMEGAS